MTVKFRNELADLYGVLQNPGLPDNTVESDFDLARLTSALQEQPGIVILDRSPSASDGTAYVSFTFDSKPAVIPQLAHSLACSLDRRVCIWALTVEYVVSGVPTIRLATAPANVGVLAESVRNSIHQALAV